MRPPRTSDAYCLVVALACTAILLAVAAIGWVR